MPAKNPYKRPTLHRGGEGAGFPARSVFKLEEIDRRVRLLKKGQRVLDLGAAPGSWSMYAAEKIGAEGQAARDRSRAARRALGPNAHVSCRATRSRSTTTHLAMFAPYDVVLSDMAPAHHRHAATPIRRGASSSSCARSRSPRRCSPRRQLRRQDLHGADFPLPKNG